MSSKKYGKDKPTESSESLSTAEEASTVTQDINRLDLLRRTTP
jgi:hypothetical protein